MSVTMTCHVPPHSSTDGSDLPTERSFSTQSTAVQGAYTYIL